LAVSRRVAISEHESGIVPEKRPYRSLKVTPEPIPSTNKRKVPSSAPVQPAKLEKPDKRRRYSEPPLAVTSTSYSAPSYSPDLSAAAHAPLASDEDMLTLLADLPFDDEPFLLELDFVPDASKSVPMIRTPCSAPPLDASAFLKDALHAALSKGFYDSSYTASSVTVSQNHASPADECATDVEDVFDFASLDETSLFRDLGFSFTSELSFSGIF